MARKRKNVTTEVSTDEVTQRAKPRPRKKQAVTKTNSTLVKALIRRNATTSPLLLLPSEVRQNILSHLIGDKLIHVKYLDGYKLHHANKAKIEYIRQNEQGDPIVIEDDQTDELPSYTESDTGSYIIVDTDDDDTVNDIVICGHNDRGGNALYEAEYASPVTGPVSPFVRDPHSALRHAICVAHLSEQSAYKEAVFGGAIIPEDDSPDFYVASCEDRHSACSMCGGGDMFLRQDLKVDLNVLGVCRQLYEEANYLLWATNTFSFEDPKSFEKFFGSLNPAQKRNLKNIHISAHIGEHFSNYTSTHQRSRWDSDYWGKALKMSTLRMLQGVQTLHLCINLGFQGFCPTLSKELAEEQIGRCRQEDMEPILRLRALSVKKVTVIVSDEPRKLEADGRIAHRWTVIRKNKYAESVCVQLVDDHGAELVKTEAEAANLARKKASRINAASTVKRYKRVLRYKQAEVERITKWASIEEDSAVLAKQKADESPKTGLKKAAMLLLAAEKQREKAANARETLTIAVKQQLIWQENVANAKEKYKRAMARLGATPDEIEDEIDFQDLMEGIDTSEIDLDGQA